MCYKLQYSEVKFDYDIAKYTVRYLYAFVLDKHYPKKIT